MCSIGFSVLSHSNTACTGNERRLIWWKALAVDSAVILLWKWLFTLLVVLLTFPWCCLFLISRLSWCTEMTGEIWTNLPRKQEKVFKKGKEKWCSLQVCLELFRSITNLPRSFREPWLWLNKRAARAELGAGESRQQSWKRRTYIQAC